MTWTEGRQLKTLTSGSKTYTYSYDRSGLRTRKQGSDRSEIRYHNVDGKPVVEVCWGAGFIWDCTLSYEYDETGSIIGFSYIRNGAADWTKYHLAKNLMGDVVAVYDDNGTKVASYTYDAWGNVLSSSGSMANVNPFRYRGYYCDSETKFYYLQSRYYDSAIGRFINADSFTSTGSDILSYNMFAYCSNNPIMGYDPCGKWTFSWGISVNANCVVGVLFSIQFVVDSNWDCAIQYSYAIPGVKDTYSLGVLDCGYGYSYAITGKDSYSDLEGYSAIQGCSAGDIMCIGVDAVTCLKSSDQLVDDLRNGVNTSFDGAQVTIGVGGGVDLHDIQSKTGTICHFNVKGVAKKVWNYIEDLLQ